MKIFVDQARGFTWRGKSVVSRRKQGSGRMAEHFYWSFITAFVLVSWNEATILWPVKFQQTPKLTLQIYKNWAQWKSGETVAQLQ